MEFKTEIFSQFDKKWALLTAGDERCFNTMTISWGALGTIWGKPAATVYVRTSRLTHEFLKKNEYFTVSFYPEAYRGQLAVLGAKSGREMNKMKDSGLTPVKAGETVTFKEAETTLVCRKLFAQKLEPEHMTEQIAKMMYSSVALHEMFIGEVVEILSNGGNP